MLEVKDILSVPTPYGPNQDCFGVTASDNNMSGWVIDGATPIPGTNYLNKKYDDIVWFVNHINFQLYHLSLLQLSPAEIFEMAMTNVRAKYLAIAPEFSSIPDYAKPTAASAWMRAHLINDRIRIDYAAFYDCYAILIPENETISFLGMEPNLEENQISQQKIQTLHKKGITECSEVQEQFISELMINRALSNTSSSNLILGLFPEAIKNLQINTLFLKKSFHLLMMTDGFFRLVDTYYKYTIQELCDITVSKGLGYLYQEISKTEREDEKCLTYPRIKPSDDVTALLFYWPG